MTTITSLAMQQEHATLRDDPKIGPPSDTRPFGEFG
ncbi:hypothetical protein COLO4_16697 [Corchorus olitorius]|uniref:Uncharacterized protein n=1 Tax=Corchorus olitorius TaxID=93759 RepID=A0A1R3JG02_9ROSI|nr:hypothetical protein COLO4_16697 [Corchorus olitorius]